MECLKEAGAVMYCKTNGKGLNGPFCGFLMTSADCHDGEWVIVGL